MDYLFTRDKNMGPSDIKHEIFDESTTNFLVSFINSILTNRMQSLKLQLLKTKLNYICASSGAPIT